MDELVAWVVFPLLGLAVCAGVGLLAERAARADLHPALIPPLGFAIAIALLGPVFATGASDVWGVALLAVAAIAGFALGRPWRLRPWLGAAAGTAAYAMHIAPVVLSGSATFLGYRLLDDTSLHLALVDWIGDHGARDLGQTPTSAYFATVADYVRSDYPLGSHALLAVLRAPLGIDAALVYQPFLALAAGLAAAAVFALLRGMRVEPVPGALIAFAALAGQLVFSFALQGGIKEITFITCLAAAAALGREVRLMALPAAALYSIYGLYALPWIAPLALLALWVHRPGLRVFATAAGVFIAAVAVHVPGSIHYWRHGRDVITSAGELGPLAGPLEPIQAAGIWLTGDYRFTPDHAWLTYALIAVALALALYGYARRRPTLLVGPPLFALLVTAPASSPYIDAKLLAIVSPAVVTAACLGVAALPRRRVAIALAVVLGGAVMVSDALAYRIAQLAPMDRLGELSAIDERFAGKGPLLVNEFEQYVKHFMRRSLASNPYERWTGARGDLRVPRPVPDHYVDLDELTDAYVQRWPLIALRRSPVASRPPSNYRRVFHGRFYDVWRRSGPPPLRHVPLGDGIVPFAEVSCAQLRALGAREALVAPVGAPLAVYDIAKAPLPPGWYRESLGAVTAAKGGTVVVVGQSGPGTVWVRGFAFRKSELLMDGDHVGAVEGLQVPEQWLLVGTTPRSPAGTHRIEVRRPRRSLAPGDGRADRLGPVVVQQGGEPRLVRTEPGRGGRLCNRLLDWIDVVRR